MVALYGKRALCLRHCMSAVYHTMVHMECCMWDPIPSDVQCYQSFALYFHQHTLMQTAAVVLLLGQP